MREYKWIHPNVDFYHVDNNSSTVITVSNSGDLCLDFYKYANNFFDAAEIIAFYLVTEAAKRKDIAKLDVWYFALLYLYRQGLELILKSILFQSVTNITDRKDIIANVRHDLKQAFEKIVELKAISLEESKNGEWLYEFLSDIAHIDNASDMFRYPFGSNLEVLFDEKTHISLLATHYNMDKAFQIIKGIYLTGQITERFTEGYEPKLIIEGGHYYRQSVVGYKYHERAFYPYFSAYSETGDFLKEKIISEDKSDLFMPMCYLYRNAIELGLKRIIIEDSHFEQDKALKIIKKKKHSICGLWNSVFVELERNPNVPEDTSIEEAHMYVQAFHDVDCNSDKFRYPCDKDLNIYFREPIQFDVENVASCFEEFCNFLDGIDCLLGQIKEYEAEMASDWGCD